MGEVNDRFIKVFKALANEERVEIIKLLKDNGEMYAQDVQSNFYLEQSTTSHHLNLLKRSGIAKSRKEGRNIFYSIDYENFKSIWEEFSKLIFEE